MDDWYRWWWVSGSKGEEAEMRCGGGGVSEEG